MGVPIMAPTSHSQPCRPGAGPDHDFQEDAPQRHDPSLVSLPHSNHYTALFGRVGTLGDVGIGERGTRAPGAQPGEQALV